MKLIAFLSTMFFSILAAGIVFAETGDASAAGGAASSTALAGAILMAVAAGMGTFSQSRAAAAALEGIARNPQSAAKVQMPLILSLAFMESLVLFALLAFFTLK